MIKVIIKDGWEGAGRIGELIGEPQYFANTGQEWSPVLWEGEEDPDWHKSDGLRPYSEKDFTGMEAWICVERETGRPRVSCYYEDEQPTNAKYTCIPVCIVPKSHFELLTIVSKDEIKTAINNAPDGSYAEEILKKILTARERC